MGVVQKALASVLLCAALVACDKSTNVEPAPVPAAAPSESRANESLAIAWFQGSVDEAFAQAKDSGTPLFLYWGAVWCPPCNVIKSTVFVDPAFIAETQHFVPVYLDGDTDDAQRWGEHFAAMGYPTLIVLNAEGEELTRLTSGMQLQRYQQVLADVRAGGIAVKTLVQRALEESSKLSDADWRLLAYYAWLADQDQVVAQAEKAALLSRLAEASPIKLLEVRSRFELLAAIENANASEDSTVSPADADLAALLERILNAPALLDANLAELQYDGASLLAAATAPNTEPRDRLAALYIKTMQATYSDTGRPWSQRLDSVYAQWLWHQQQSPDQSVPQALQGLVRDAAAAIRAEKLSGHQLQSLIPDAAHLLHKVGLSDEARSMFVEEMQRSVAPYYYMSYLSSLEQDLGNTQAALDWSRKAWEQSQGPATRTQWGLSYLNRLLELAPDQVDEIEKVLATQFQELAMHPSAFYQRSRVRLERSLLALQAWAIFDERIAMLKKLRPQISAACAALPAKSASLAVCQGYLSLTALAE